MSKIKRAIVIVLDSVGAGAMPDSEDYGDPGVNTLAHTAEYAGGLNLPHLQNLGLGNITPIEGVPPAPQPAASYGKMKEASASKDTMAGHWELMGLVVEKPFPLYPHGFPPEIMDAFFEGSGAVAALGNTPASGTEIIKELGDEHVKTGHPIVYTSGDSVFQIAAHEEVIPLEKLYAMCEAARKVCDQHQIGRVIARPFVGEKGNYTRTANRKDYPLYPPGKTTLDLLKAHGLPVMGIGKIEDIFVRQGITRAIHTKSNHNGMECLMQELSITKQGLIFVNLVDFDMLYGHRRNPAGYAQALEEFDQQLGQLLPMLQEDDLLILTADHGCDPLHTGTDHTREYVPLLAFSPNLPPKNLGTRDSFADIGITVLEIFGVDHDFKGKSIVP